MDLLLVQNKHLRWPDGFTLQPKGHSHMSYPQGDPTKLIRTSKLVGPLKLQLVLCIEKRNNMFLTSCLQLSCSISHDMTRSSSVVSQRAMLWHPQVPSWRRWSCRLHTSLSRSGNGGVAAPQAAGLGDGGAWPCGERGQRSTTMRWPELGLHLRNGRCSDEASSSGLRSSVVHRTRILG
jgi:hypothetical protein